MKRPTHTLLRCLVVGCLLAATALTTGCSREQDRVLVILGPWIGDEEKAFKDHTIPILEEILEKKEVDREIDYQGTRSPRETLVAQLRAGSSPDVAILNSLGELVEYAREGAVRPLSMKTGKRARAPWAPDIMLSGESEAYWVPVRIDLKSIVWTRAEVADPVTQWCLGMSDGAGSGWPGTDWIEDLILQRSGWAAYDDWATGRLSWESEEVRQAWVDWAVLLRTENGGQGNETLKEALTTHFNELPGNKAGLLNTACTHEHQGSFIRRYYGDQDVVPAPTTDFLPFTPEDRDVFEVSGDMAAVFDTSDDAARHLLSALTSVAARKEWVGGIENPSEWPLFPNWPAPSAAGEPGGTFEVQRLLDNAERVCFDASDAMPPTLRNAFYRAVLEFLSAVAEMDPWEEEPPQLRDLLKQLEEERKRQEEEGAFVIRHLCD